MSAQVTLNRDASVDFLDGVRLSIPVVVAASPFGFLFGALAVQNGFSVFEAGLMSALVFGGASQMVGIDLFGQNVPAWLVVFSIFAVNFRHVLYSATVGRYVGDWQPWQRAACFFFLVDPAYAESERRIDSGRPITVPWFMGLAIPNYVMWPTTTVIGALFGRMIPDTHALGLDYMLPIYFLGLVLGFRRRRNWLPVVAVSGVVSVVAVHVVGSPWHVSVGALAGIALAAVMAPKVAPPPEDPPADELDAGP